MKTANKGYVNSLTEGQMEVDKFSDNYMALAYVIAGIKVAPGKYEKIEVKSACTAFGLYDSKTNSCTRSDNEFGKDDSKFKITNIITDEVKICNSCQEVCDLTGIKRNKISIYSTKKYKYKDKYLIERIGKYSYNHCRKPVMLTNLDNNEVIKFESVKKASEYLKISRSAATYYLSTGKYKNYKFEKIN